MTLRSSSTTSVIAPSCSPRKRSPMSDVTQPTVFEVPTTDVAIIIADFDQATLPVPAEERELAGVGMGKPYVTAVDLASRRLWDDGYEQVEQVSVFSHNRVVVLFVKRED